jgi:lysophospholipase L1-like esterase
MIPPFLSLPHWFAFSRSLRSVFCALALGLVTLGLAPSPGRAASDQTPSAFFLQDGDSVCFYGDSITEQRFYGVDVQTYVRTRFPSLRVKFVNSGVGGDKVTGGWAGAIDLRLKRDVFPFKPNVVTIMLGMNDAAYRPFDQKIFDDYARGYEHIIQSLQQHLPGVRIVLLEPSPYDDVTEAPKFPGGYNAVLLRYAAFVRELAARHHLPCVDLNRPLLDVVEKLQAEQPRLAPAVIPQRIHPSAAGELVMAQSILRAWNAPATVTAVAIDARAGAVTNADNSTATELRQAGGVISWIQHDRSLPFPILGLHEDWPQFPPTERNWGSLSFFWPAPLPKWDYTSAATAAIVKASGFYEALNRQTLRITGLTGKTYRLAIDGQTIGDFSARSLDEGINLAKYRTPMLEQSYRVLALVWQQVQWRFFAWRGLQTQLSFDNDPAVKNATRDLVAALETQREGFLQGQYEAARPQPTHYTLTLLP